MRRRSLFKTAVILFSLVALSLGIVGWLLKREPEFYVRENTALAGDEDSIQSGKVVTRLNELMEDMRSSQKNDWGATLSAGELNSFFRDGGSGTNPLSKGLVANLPDPRVAIEDDRLRIAFRYGEEFRSTVVQMELRMWLVKDQSNLVAVEIVRFQAGGVPLPKSWVIDDIAATARGLSADVNWYRRGGNPVALCKLYANQNRPETQITTLRIGDGGLSIGGRHTGMLPVVPIAGK